MSKSKLSKHILEMKFMQRTAVRVQKEESEQEQQAYIDDEHWVLDVATLKQKQNKYVLEPSYVPCEELGFGRISYKGFNPDIERLHKDLTEEEDLDRSEAREQEGMVTDAEMASRFESLVGTIGNKFKRKRDRSQREYAYQEKAPQQSTEVADEDDAEQRCKRLLEEIKKVRGGQFMKPRDDDDDEIALV